MPKYALNERDERYYERYFDRQRNYTTFDGKHFSHVRIVGRRITDYNPNYRYKEERNEPTAMRFRESDSGVTTLPDGEYFVCNICGWIGQSYDGDEYNEAHFENHEVIAMPLEYIEGGIPITGDTFVDEKDIIKSITPDF